MFDGLSRTDVRFKPLVGKQVELTHNGVNWIGVLQFAGINTLHDQFHVTLSGTPLWPVNPNSIKEIK